MKKLLTLFTILLFCACDEPVKIDSADWSGTISASDERNTIMNSFTDAYENKDKEAALAIFADDAIFHVNDAELTAKEVVDVFMAGHDHFDDVKKLLEVLHELVNNGNTVVVIEHNLDVIKTADWILDIGPDGGDKGGELVYEGELEGILKIKNSYTGQYLKKMI